MRDLIREDFEKCYDIAQRASNFLESIETRVYALRVKLLRMKLCADDLGLDGLAARLDALSFEAARVCEDIQAHRTERVKP